MIDDKEVLIDSSEPVETAKTDLSSKIVPDQKNDIRFGASTYQSQTRDNSHNYLQIFLLLSVSIILFYLILSNRHDGKFFHFNEQEFNFYREYKYIHTQPQYIIKLNNYFLFS